MKPDNLEDLYWREWPVDTPDTYRGWSKPLLVCNDCNEIYIGVYCEYSEFGWEDRTTGNAILGVEAWMPLPSSVLGEDYV